MFEYDKLIKEEIEVPRSDDIPNICLDNINNLYPKKSREWYLDDDGNQVYRVNGVFIYSSVTGRSESIDKKCYEHNKSISDELGKVYVTLAGEMMEANCGNDNPSDIARINPFYGYSWY